jgi:hypothetical protein
MNRLRVPPLTEREVSISTFSVSPMVGPYQLDNEYCIFQKRSWVIFRCGFFLGMFLVLLVIVIIGRK